MTSLVIYGDTSGATTVAANATAGTNTLTLPTNTGRLAMDTTLSFKNRIINGGMMIDQRNAGASVTPTNGQYLVDRWQAILSQASKYSAQQNAGSVTPPVGFTNYLGITSLSSYSVGATDQFRIRQFIEGFNTADLAWGTINAKTVTLSFQVYSSLTGTFGGALQNSASNRSYPFTYSIPVANTWTQASITIAGDTTGTWLANNSTGIQVSIGLGCGTTQSGTAGVWAGTEYDSATGATSVVGTNGATFYITGVQLEVGSQATAFDFRDYGRELMLCQRYYQRVNNATEGVSVTSGCIYSTGNYYSSYPLKVTMRASPTFTVSAANDFQILGNFSQQRCSDVSTSNTNPNVIEIYAGYSGGSTTTGSGATLRTYNTTGWFAVAAEL